MVACVIVCTLKVQQRKYLEYSSYFLCYFLNCSAKFEIVQKLGKKEIVANTPWASHDGPRWQIGAYNFEIQLYVLDVVHL